MSSEANASSTGVCGVNVVEPLKLKIHLHEVVFAVLVIRPPCVTAIKHHPILRRVCDNLATDRWVGCVVPICPSVRR
jgi:hypothetical protein